MRTDTREIPTTKLCAWCKINLTAIPTQPAMYRGFLVHPCCAQAAAAEDAANAADLLREESTYPEAELARV